MTFLLVLLFPLCWANCPTDIKCEKSFNKCYKFETRDASYFDAEEDCVSLGGHLTSIQNAFENAVVGETADLMFAAHTDYWIGANYIINNKWSWTDGSAWHFTDWFPGNPTVQTQSVASMLLTSHMWTRSADPETSKPYVCELPYLNQEPVTCPSVAPPVTCPTLSCTTASCLPRCESGWTLFGDTNQCYKVGFAEDFWSAEDICIESGGHLASIHTDEENNFISLLASTGHPVSDYDCTWIGLTRLADQWTWTDGTPLDYRLWGPDPEYDGDHAADCTRIYTDGWDGGTGWNNRWQTDYCSRTIRNYVCKKPAY